eukprot:symbB.v1.2.022649.t2/scaffold2004.1/size154144/4
MHIAQSFTRCRASCNGSLWCLAGRRSLRWDVLRRSYQRRDFFQSPVVFQVDSIGTAGDATDTSRLRYWHRLQKDLFTADGRFPSQADRFRAAREAAMMLGHQDREIFLAPEDFLHLLKDTVLCPAISIELLQLVYQNRLLCAQSAFGGRQDRRQFFRNQALYLYAEQALLVRNCFQQLLEHGRLAEEEVDLFEFQAVLNCLDAGDTENPEPEVRDAKVSSFAPAAFGHQEGLLADFLIDASQVGPTDFFRKSWARW